MKKILVVCIGNICRSPMAQGLLSAALPDRMVLSAGLGALVGHAADPIAVELMAKRGINIATHRAQQINSALTSQSELILTMDLEQKRFIEETYVATRGKVFRLGEFQSVDILDPYRLGEEKFIEAAELISEGVSAWSARILQMN